MDVGFVKATNRWRPKGQPASELGESALQEAPFRHRLSVAFSCACMQCDVGADCASAPPVRRTGDQLPPAGPVDRREHDDHDDDYPPTEPAHRRRIDVYLFWNEPTSRVTVGVLDA